MNHLKRSERPTHMLVFQCLSHQLFEVLNRDTNSAPISRVKFSHAYVHRGHRFETLAPPRSLKTVLRKYRGRKGTSQAAKR